MSKYGSICQDADAFLKGHDQARLLSPSAAVDACERAFAARICIIGVEGGQWMNPGIMARLDSIWSAIRAPTTREEVAHWNQEATNFIREQARKSPDPNLPPANVFILTGRKTAF